MGAQLHQLGATCLSSRFQCLNHPRDEDLSDQLRKEKENHFCFRVNLYEEHTVDSVLFFPDLFLSFRRIRGIEQSSRYSAEKSWSLVWKPGRALTCPFVGYGTRFVSRGASVCHVAIDVQLNLVGVWLDGLLETECVVIHWLYSSMFLLFLFDFLGDWCTDVLIFLPHLVTRLDNDLCVLFVQVTITPGDADV